MNKYINNKRWSILLVVMILATSVIILFLTVSSLTKNYQDQIWKLAYWVVTKYSAESAIEEAIVRYFETSEKADTPNKRRENIIYGKIRDKDIKGSIINKNLLKNTNVKSIDKDIIINFLDDKTSDKVIWINHVWDVYVSATRLVDSIRTRINPFWLYEFRLTAEEREENWSWAQNKIKKLKLTWSKTNWDPENASIEIIQARWPLSQKWNIQTHRIEFPHWSDYIDNWYYAFWDLWEKEVPNEAILNLPTNNDYKRDSQCLNCFEKYEYIFIFKAKTYPITLMIEWLDSSWNKIQLPDRYVYFNSVSKIWWTNEQWTNFLWWDNIYNSYSKNIKTKKEIYTNFDSNFDYARNFMIF